MEKTLKSGIIPDISSLNIYIGYFNSFENSQLSLNAGAILQRIETEPLTVKLLNHIFHDLKLLISETTPEKFFSVRVFDRSTATTKLPVIAILEDIRSPFNVGSIFRTADCFGVSMLLLTGITPTPESSKVTKSSMDTIDSTEWKRFEKTEDAIKYAKESGYVVVALETSDNAEMINNINTNRKMCFVFGNEEYGLSLETISQCDSVAIIPLLGKKNSLNVANSFAVATYQYMIDNCNKL